jgi:hypothetical protein
MTRFWDVMSFIAQAGMLVVVITAFVLVIL